jgi:polysaccharide biosynthesis/export protein
MTNFVKFLFIFLTAVLFLGGCIPNRRLIYLQHKDDPERGEVKTSDSISRVYNTRFSEYVLQPQDIVTIRVATITPSEFDFVQKYEEQLGLIRSLNQYDQANQAGSTRMRSSGGSSGQNGEGVMAPIALDRQQTGFYLDHDGNLELPYVGTLKLAGLTIAQAEQLIKEKLLGYFETPVIRIQLLSFHFTILGEVNSEGRYTSFNPNPSIIDAIAIAGNLNDFADRSKLKIVRFQAGQADVFYVNMLSEDLLAQSGFYLKPNDLIIVPPLEARAIRKYTLPNYSTAISLVTTTLTLILFLISVNKN